MIGKHYSERHNKVFGNRPEDIEGYEEAINSNEMYVPHHVLEWKYSKEELKLMGRYDKVSPDELIWMPENVHNFNPTLHKDVRDYIYKEKSQETKNKISKAVKGRNNNPRKLVRSEFGLKYMERFGVTYKDSDITHYKAEWNYWKTHNHKCRWEVKSNVCFKSISKETH